MNETNIVYREDYKGYEILIGYDECGVDRPYMLGTVALCEPAQLRTGLGDSDYTFGSHYDLFRQLLEEVGVEDAEDIPRADLEEHVDKYYVTKYVYMYAHGGVVLSTSPFSCSWDSGQVGYIFAKKKDGVKDEDTEKQLDTDIERLSAYANGEVYYFEIPGLPDELYESCGYIGNHEDSGLLEEAKLTIDEFLEGSHEVMFAVTYARTYKLRVPNNVENEENYAMYEINHIVHDEDIVEIVKVVE